MTTVAEDTEKAKAEAVKARNKEMEAREEKLNAGKTGKGTRTFLGMTRGKNPREIQYENWDNSLPDTLPKSLGEFMTLSGLDKLTGEGESEAAVVRRLILGDNDILYAEASDPVAEFVEASWPTDVQKQFKMIVKNYATALTISIDDAVDAIKPNFVLGLAKAAEAKKALVNASAKRIAI